MKIPTPENSNRHIPPVGPGCVGLTHDMGAVFFGTMERYTGANFDGCWGTA